MKKTGIGVKNKVLAAMCIVVLGMVGCGDNGGNPNDGGGTTRTLTVTANPANGGTVSPTGKSTYADKARITIKATPANGYTFAGWTGAPSGIDASNSSITVTMNANLALIANFETISAQTHSVTVSSDGIGATGGGNYAEGSTVTINAGTAPVNQQFKNWTTTSAGVTFADENSQITTFTMPANAVTVTANFETIPTYTITYSGNENTGGQAPTDDTQYQSGTAVTVMDSGNLTKTGYTFGGWSTEQDGSGISYSTGSEFNITANIVNP